MLLAPIVPIPMLAEIQADRYHMVLHPLCEIEEYWDFYTRVEGFKILDNGAAEGGRLPDAEELLKTAFQLRADEIIAPDVYGDCNRSLTLLRMFMPIAENYHVMAVLQSSTWPEFDQIFHYAMHLGASSLGLPRVMCRKLGPAARLAAAEIIRRETDIPVHALGSTPHLNEAKDLARQGIVRGIDSSAPVVLGLNNQGLHDLYKERPHDYFERVPTQPARANLEEFRRWCETKAPAGEV
jgi:hypothetical protein